MIEKNYTVVETMEDRGAILAHINSYDYFAFDVETTGLNTRKEKVIGFSISGKAGDAFYYPIMRWDGKKLVDCGSRTTALHLLNLLKEKELLMWNGSFDIRVTKNDLGIDLTDSLIADGMLMAHTLMEEGPFGLKKVGVLKQREIGYDVETTADAEAIELKENVAKNGGSITKANYEMYKADLPVLGKYACADADITFRLCEYFQNELEKEGLLEFFFDDEVMPLYKEVTIPMEDRGVELDMDLINQTNESIKKDLIDIENKVINSLFETEEAKKWYKDKIKNFTETKHSGNFAQGVAEYFKLDLPILEKSKKYKMGKSVLKKLPDSEAKEFLTRPTYNTIEFEENEEDENGDLQLVIKTRRETIEYPEIAFSEEIDFKIKKLLYEKKNDKKINISSKPQLSEIAFDYMGIKELAKTPKGKKKFDDDMITKIEEEGHEWASLLGDYNKLIKIKGTYIDRFLDAQEDGKYYFSYKQHGTISGRYGSDAQQLPRPKEEGQLSPLVLKYTNVIRKFFISGEGRKFVDCDYESLEPHVFAHVSNEEGIKDIFRKGHDFYSTIAINTEMLDGVSPDKKAENYLGAVDKIRRQNAKAYALGVPYGMGGYALGKTLDIPTEDAEELVNNYLGAYPNLKKWIEQTKKTVRAKGYISTQVGRIRHLPRVKELYAKHKDKLLDYKYRNKIGARMAPEGDKSGHEVVKDMYKDFKNGQNNSINFQIQSLSASIVNRAAIAINRYFKEIGVDGWCCAQIHDQLIVNIPEKDQEIHAKKVQYLMENTTKLSLDLKAPPEISVNWYEGH